MRAALPDQDGAWTYAAASGGITDTSDVAIKAAVAGHRNYLTGIQITNADATVATEVVIKDGSTVIWRGWVPAGATASTAGFNVSGIVFATPLRSSVNTALNVAAITTSAVLYVNAQGYVAP